jgi:hypothetical protein
VAKDAGDGTLVLRKEIRFTRTRMPWQIGFERIR